MKKKEISTLIQSMKCQRTDALTKKSMDLKSIVQERELTKLMYFWNPAGNASGRRWNEKKRNIEIDVALTSTFSINYKRYYSESCNYVYASDEIICSDKDISFTVADAKKIIACIDEVLTKRSCKEDS